LRRFWCRRRRGISNVLREGVAEEDREEDESCDRKKKESGLLQKHVLTGMIKNISRIDARSKVFHRPEIMRCCQMVRRRLF
jgi:hypothetical protein